MAQRNRRDGKKADVYDTPGSQEVTPTDDAATRRLGGAETYTTPSTPPAVEPAPPVISTATASTPVTPRVVHSPAVERPLPPPTATPNVDLTVAAPTDRVRWGPILAGLFTTLTTALLLTLLAAALAAGQAEPNSTARSFGVGSAIAAGLIWLLSFGIGGYVAARTMALPGRSNGFFNGLMVSMVGIPLLLYALSSLFGSLLGTAGSIASTVTQAVAPAAGQAANDPNAQVAASDAAGSAQAAASGAASAAASVVASAQASADEIGDRVAQVGLGSLVPPVAALIASGLGGLAGARKPDEDDAVVGRRA